jgi:hypothetical protein
MIHTLKSKIGMTDDNYRAMLEGFGVGSSKDLSTANAKAFIEALMGMVTGGQTHVWQKGGSGVPAERKRYATSNAVATYAQQAKIRRLWYEVSRAPEPDRALNNFLEKRFRISHIAWLPRERVGKVIHTLKAMQSQLKTDLHTTLKGE